MGAVLVKPWSMLVKKDIVELWRLQNLVEVGIRGAVEVVNEEGQ